MGVASISMPEALLERINEFADEHGYSGRSEVVREGTRTLLEEFQGRNIDGQKHTSTVTVVFEYCQPAVQQRLTGVHHEYDTIPIRQHRSGSTGCPDCGLLDYLRRQRPYSVMT